MPAQHPSRIATVLKKSRSVFTSIFILSAALNVLLLGGALYMMLVYDVVLPAGSLPTLWGLLLIVILVYAFQTIIDIIRTRLLSRVGATIDQDLGQDIFDLVSQLAIDRPGKGESLQPIRDLDQVRNFLASSGLLAIADLPWMIFFILVLALLHWSLGLTVLLGGIALLALTYSTDRLTRAPTELLTHNANQRLALAESSRRHAEILKAMAMGPDMQRRWNGYSQAFLGAQQSLADTAGTMGSISKIARMLLQSLVLTVGAILVIEGKATGGVIFASSILASRALAPVEQAIGNWRSLAAARQSWRRLEHHLAELSPEHIPLHLPTPSRQLQVQHLAVIPPGATNPALAGIAFTLAAGDVLGVIGPSGSGKSTLLRVMAGIWPPTHGHVRLDSAALDQYAEQQRGRALGYLPQNAELIDGSIAENIARFMEGAKSDHVISAAEMAGVHELVKRMPQGYGTTVGPNGAFLSAGQRQRIALARALFGNPFLLLLDEPNSNLDPEGEAALAAAVDGVRERGGIVILAAHRRSILRSADKMLHLEAGRMKSFGPKHRVLEELER
ncbi:type I secretion system permease/ATPase [Rhizorhapis suberifaciens]|uniref:ATP-binding cassette subfamily C protein n=1 Tax=Rhizorhapis suberifaciens TaxID=13656 RepID=A0A840HUL1_9SPHN|nr:type I secretion system permease/ATPase [Rhizorhapis suberifaciens]MBB4641279.1 ATP-binding cassette subfamily C protein [Rhizorhapis suberifaciens]